MLQAKGYFRGPFLLSALHPWVSWRRFRFLIALALSGLGHRALLRVLSDALQGLRTPPLVNRRLLNVHFLNLVNFDDIRIRNVALFAVELLQLRQVSCRPKLDAVEAFLDRDHPVGAGLIFLDYWAQDDVRLLLLHACFCLSGFILIGDGGFFPCRGHSDVSLKLNGIRGSEGSKLLPELRGVLPLSPRPMVATDLLDLLGIPTLGHADVILHSVCGNDAHTAPVPHSEPAALLALLKVCLFSMLVLDTLLRKGFELGLSPVRDQPLSRFLTVRLEVVTQVARGS